MGYHALASRNTVLTKYTGCSTRLGASVLVASSGSRGEALILRMQATSRSHQAAISLATICSREAAIRSESTACL